MCVLSDNKFIGERAGNQLKARYFSSQYWLIEELDSFRFLVRGRNILDLDSVISNFKDCKSLFSGGDTLNYGFNIPETFATPIGYTRKSFADGAIYFESTGFTPTTLSPSVQQKKYIVLSEGGTTLYYPCTSFSQSNNDCYSMFQSDPNPVLLHELPVYETPINCNNTLTTNYCAIQFVSANQNATLGCTLTETYLMAEISRAGGTGLTQYRVTDTSGNIVRDWTYPIIETSVAFKLPYGTYNIQARDSDTLTCFTRYDNIVLSSQNCNNTTTPPPTPTTNTPFTVYVVSIDCSNGNIVLGVSGVDSTLVQYSITDIRGYDYGSVITIPSNKRNGVVLDIYARRTDTGQVVSTHYTTACLSNTTQYQCTMTIGSVSPYNGSSTNYLVTLNAIDPGLDTIYWWYGVNTSSLQGPFTATRDYNQMYVNIPSNVTSGNYIIRVGGTRPDGISCYADSSFTYTQSTTRPACTLTVYSVTQNPTYSNLYKVKLNYNLSVASPFTWRIRRESDNFIWDDNRTWTPDGNGEIEVDFLTKSAGNYYIDIFSINANCSTNVLIGHSGLQRTCTMTLGSATATSDPNTFTYVVNSADANIGPFIWTIRRTVDNFEVRSQETPVQLTDGKVAVNFAGLPSGVYTVRISAQGAICYADGGISYTIPTTNVPTTLAPNGIDMTGSCHVLYTVDTRLYRYNPVTNAVVGSFVNLNEYYNDIALKNNTLYATGFQNGSGTFVDVINLATLDKVRYDFDVAIRNSGDNFGIFGMTTDNNGDIYVSGANITKLNFSNMSATKIVELKSGSGINTHYYKTQGDLVYNFANDSFFVSVYDMFYGDVPEYFKLIEITKNGTILREIVTISESCLGMFGYNNELYMIFNNGAVYKLIPSNNTLQLSSLNVNQSVAGSTQNPSCTPSLSI